MIDTNTWLPEMVLIEDYNGNWETYLEAVYNFFVEDFIRSVPKFQGRSLKLKRFPMYQNKEATFWHIISQSEENSKEEEDRKIDFDRCKRIRWPRPIIDHCEHKDIKIWSNHRNKQVRICILFDPMDYLVVIARNPDFDLFLTAYPITYPHHKRRLLREYEVFLKNNAAKR